MSKKFCQCIFSFICCARCNFSLHECYHRSVYSIFPSRYLLF